MGSLLDRRRPFLINQLYAENYGKVSGKHYTNRSRVQFEFRNMSSEKELEIVRIGKQLEKLANSQTPVRARWEGRERLECSKTAFPLVSCLCRKLNFFAN